ncbi:Zinc finger and SCAN domain-containing protein 29 [Chelonia mydas]|uniref:Zinc finger and SCAN domain-containing protein 29 n=1 Tax=Chelonia mydas TaxID=8469 RepID=M7B719_CHEMY|nr:Zinc finger and SCAN domain-containing protein 29 [Chelonia mydas]
MRDRGYIRDATQCHVKLKQLRQVYQKTKESNGHSRTEPQTCRFYDELHAILGGAATTTPPLSDDGVLSAMAEDFADGEDEEEDELGESPQHTVLPDSQDLSITLTEMPSQPIKAREGTSEKCQKAQSKFGMQSTSEQKFTDLGNPVTASLVQYGIIKLQKKRMHEDLSE